MMRLNLICVLVGALAVDFAVGVLWNSRPLIKVRLRPPRHPLMPIMSSSNQNPQYHRAHTFPPRPPSLLSHLKMPVFSYRPPTSSLGSIFMKHPPPQPVPLQSQKLNYFRGPPHHFIQDEMLSDKHKLIKFETPGANLIENPGYTLSSSLDGGQHGYLSPKYKGWKPISKPQFQLPTRESEPPRHSYPTTEAYRDIHGKHHKMMLTTLFRDNVKNIKPPPHIKLKPEYSENRGVAIPLPPELGGSSITLPSSIFMDHPQNSNNYKFFPPSAPTSQSEEKPIIRKPFPKFHQRLRANEKANQSADTGTKTDTGSGELPQLFNKFKSIRPKFKPATPPPSYDNEPENDGISPTKLPKNISPFPTKAPETSAQPALNFKEKFKKVRTRIRTGVRARPEGHVNTEDLSQMFSQQRPDPSETLISPKEAYGDPGRQQEHNSQPYNPRPAFSKTTNPISYPPQEQSPVSRYPDKPRVEYSREHKNPPTPLPEVSGNKISGGGNVNVVGSKGGGGDKPHRKRKQQQQTVEHTRNPDPIPPPFVYSEGPGYSEEFYLPPGFLQNPSLNGHNPVSFMTMPNSRPQVIHHTGHNEHSPHTPHHLYPINVMGSTEHHIKSNHPALGTRPNPNYVQNNRPDFVFMNIQNGQVQPTGPSQDFISPAYDTTPQPFHHHSTPFPYHHHGHPSENNLRYHPTSSGSPYAYPSDSRFHPHYISYPNNHFNGDSNPQHSKRNSHMRHHLNHEPSTQPYPTPLESYASTEYKQIPMEFMNHLRPILLDEGQEDSNVPIPMQIQTAPSAHNDFYSGEMYPGKDYFDNFFKAYETPNPQETTKRYEAQPSGNTPVRIPFDSYKSSSNSQPQILRPNPEVWNETSTTTPRWSPPKTPIISVSPLQEYTFESTISPIQDIELYHIKPEGSKSWSKLKSSAGEGFSSSTEAYASATTKFKRLSSTEDGGVEANTAKSTLSPTFSPEKKGEAVDGGTVRPGSGELQTKSEASSSTTPRNFRMRGTRPWNDKETTTQQAGTRPLRRRKVGIPTSRFFTSPRVNEVEEEVLTEPPVTTHRPRRLILSTSTGATMGERADDSSESAEAVRAKRLKARRRYFNRRMNVHSNRGGMIGLRATTPAAADLTDAVTYGESQWFRIDPEDGKAGEKSGKIPVETPSIPAVDNLTTSSSFSSRLLSTTPNAKLEPLEMSSESLIESESASGNNFFAAAAVSSAAETQAKPDTRVGSQTEPMS